MGRIRQKKIIGIGELYESFITSLPILSAIQFISVLAVLYNQLQPTLVSLIPGITLIRFLIVLTVIMLGVMILVYKFLIPSIWTFRGKQLYGFESQLMEEIQALRKDINKAKEEKIVKEVYCTDCNGEAAVKLEDCPAYKEKMKEERK